MKKVILTDVDDVLLSWEYSFHTWMETHGYVKQPDKFQWDVSKTYGITKEESLNLVTLFNDSAAIGFLPPFRDAQYYVRLLHEKHKYQFIVITSSSSDDFAMKLRIRNLKKLFGNNAFWAFHILPIREDKTDILKMYAKRYPGALWIEDNVENAFIGSELGFESVLMVHGRNKVYQEDPRITPVTTWEEIYNIIVGEKDSGWTRDDL